MQFWHKEAIGSSFCVDHFVETLGKLSLHALGFFSV